MALLPILMDYVDEINRNWDDPSFSASVPLYLTPQGSGGNRGQQLRWNRGGPLGHLFYPLESELKPGSEDYQVSIDVKSFKPEEISVKVKDREILVEGKHEERQDQHGYVSRQFSRRYVLPEKFDVDSVSTVLNTDGKMTIKALKPAAIETSEKVIPIQRVATIEKPDEGAAGKKPAVVHKKTEE